MLSDLETQAKLIEHYRRIILDSSSMVRRCDDAIEELLKTRNVQTYVKRHAERYEAYERMKRAAESLALTIADETLTTVEP